MLRYKRIFTGNQCNNKCLYCSYRKKPTSQPDLNEIIADINNPYLPPHPPLAKGGKEDVTKEGYRGIKSRDEIFLQADGIALYGGEPTLSNDIFEILSQALINGYRRIKLFTNGRSLSHTQFLQNLLSSGCRLFEIKLWGSRPELHDHLTQTPGSFRETVRGMENLAGLTQEKFVCIRIPVCKENHIDLESTIAAAMSFRIDRIIISLEDYSLALKNLMLHLKNAINISIFNRTWILTEGIPFCIMQGFEQHVGEIYSGWDTFYERTYNHHKFCAECVYKEICPGIEKKYLEQFGDSEFSSVTENKYLQDIKALL